MPVRKENVRFLVASDQEPGHPLKLGCRLWRSHVNEACKDGRTTNVATSAVLWFHPWLSGAGGAA